jgi:uncharacterized integral membrane protein (TIGR00698 family)
VPVAGAPVIAILLGVAARTAGALPARYGRGIAYSSRTVLQAAIVASGFDISLRTIFRTGLSTLPICLGTIAVALACAIFVGRLLRLEIKLRQLVGFGTAICGVSAIAAVSLVTEPAEEDIALAVATIFCYNIVAVLTFPMLGHALGLSQAQFGVWAGTAINDTSSVVAAGFSYGHEAGVRATIVKLTRATLILPTVAAIAALQLRARREACNPIPWARIVPWFILWFLVAALVNTIGLVPAAWHDAITVIAGFLISTALAAIGLQTTLSRILSAGARPLALGFILWAAVAVSSLVFQHVAGL